MIVYEKWIPLDTLTRRRHWFDINYNKLYDSGVLIYGPMI